MSPPWTTKDLAERLRTTEQMIRRWTRQRRLPRIKLGARYLYDPVQIGRVLESVSQPANPQG
jgi:excisionase family DNA binding protein